jgi:hypothetical protein
LGVTQPLSSRSALADAASQFVARNMELGELLEAVELASRQDDERRVAIYGAEVRRRVAEETPYA